MNIFSDDAKGYEKERVIIARKKRGEHDDQFEHYSSSKKKNEQGAKGNDVALTLLALELASPEALQACWGRIDDLQTRLDAALLENAEDLERLEDNAAKLEDGTAVYYDPGNGRFYYADDTIVPRDEEPTDIPENPSTRQDYQEAKRREVELAAIQTGILDPARETLRKGDVTNGQLEEVEKGLDEAEKYINRETDSLSVPSKDQNQTAEQQVTGLDFSFPPAMG